MRADDDTVHRQIDPVRHGRSCRGSGRGGRAPLSGAGFDSARWMYVALCGYQCRLGNRHTCETRKACHRPAPRKTDHRCRWRGLPMYTHRSGRSISALPWCALSRQQRLFFCPMGARVGLTRGLSALGILRFARAQNLDSSQSQWQSFGGVTLCEARLERIGPSRTMWRRVRPPASRPGLVLRCTSAT